MIDILPRHKWRGFLLPLSLVLRDGFGGFAGRAPYFSGSYLQARYFPRAPR